MRRITAFFLACVCLLCAVSAAAEEIKIVLWNCEKMFDVGTVNSRAADLQEFGQQFPDADIIILDEVTSLAVVNAARDKMGFTGFHTACSDFNQNDNDTFNSLEVGIISKFPLTNVVEFDVTPDQTGAADEPQEQPLEKVNLPGIADVQPGRGFLTAHIPSLGLTVVCTHLKSSGGGQEDDNAKKREFVAAAMAKFVAGKLAADIAATLLVAGDMNVGETDTKKNGFRLDEDHDNPADGDLYDDTHAIFSHGLVDGLHMASLTKGIRGETYDDPQFAGSGPIDCMYVVGSQAADFTLARKTTKTFGSDHFAVSTRLLFSGTAPTPQPGGGTTPAGSGSIRITALLPDPPGADGGNEWVELTNTGRAAVNLDGWKMKDKANNEVLLTGNIAAGAKRKIQLADGQMPLNQNGDEVTLLNAAGAAVHQVSYTAAQVRVGQPITFQP